PLRGKWPGFSPQGRCFLELAPLATGRSGLTSGRSVAGRRGILPTGDRWGKRLDVPKRSRSAIRQPTLLNAVIQPRVRDRGGVAMLRRTVSAIDEGLWNRVPALAPGTMGDVLPRCEAALGRTFMPLLDHFHPPLLGQRHWEGFHGRWAAALADGL